MHIPVQAFAALHVRLQQLGRAIRKDDLQRRVSWKRDGPNIADPHLLRQPVRSKSSRALQSEAELPIAKQRLAKAQ